MAARRRSPLGREALELIAQRFRTLGDPTRLALLQALFDGEKTVQELSELAGTGQANTSKHLALLADQGLVVRRKDGLFVRYSIEDPTIHQLCEVVCGSLAKRYDAVRRHFAPR